MFIKYNNERIYRHPNPIIRFIERRRVSLLLKSLNPNPSDVILAAGCGEGYIENQIHKYRKFFMVDLSKTAIKKAKVNLKHMPNLEFLQADLEKLPFPKAKFDKIECSEVIEHVWEPEKMLNEFHRVLKNNGSLVISFPNEPLINFLKRVLISLGLFHSFFPNIPDNMLQEWHLRAMDFNRFKEIINHNWQVTNISGAPFIFFPIRFIITCQPV